MLPPAGTPGRRLRARIWLLASLALAGMALAACRASEERFATETAEAVVTVRTTPTNTPSGDMLLIDDDPVIRVYVPAVDGPALYAQTAERLFRWTDNEWQPTETAVDERAILVDPVRSERLFRGNHPACSLEEEKAEPFTLSKSVDAGNTWRAIPDGDNILPLAFDPTLGDVIYGSDCGLTISTDAGETWRDYYHARGHTVVDVVVVDERLLVLEISTTGAGRLRRIDVTVPEDPELASRLVETGRVFDLDARRERVVIGGLEGVTTSVDGGETWTTSRTGLEEVTVASVEDIQPAIGQAQPADFGVLVVKLDPMNAERMFAGTVHGLFISQDAGLTWDVYNVVSRDARIINIQFAAGGNDIYVTMPEGVVIVPNP